MSDPNGPPPLIIANYLSIYAIAVWHHQDAVLLMGTYGDPVDGYTQHYIEIQCTFDELNNLLSDLARNPECFGGYAARAESVMDGLAEVLTHPDEEQDILDLEEGGILEFYDHVFSLGLMYELRLGVLVVREPSGYTLLGYTRRGKSWPEWIDGGCAQTKEEEAVYLARLMVLRYGLFLAYNGKVRRSVTLLIAGLTDPQLFILAKVQYELMEEAVRARPEELE